jgi:hypothetical protein
LLKFTVIIRDQLNLLHSSTEAAEQLKTVVAELQQVIASLGRVV